MMGPGELAFLAAPKGNCKNSQAEGSGTDETPERKGFIPYADGATIPFEEWESLRQRTEAQGTGVLCAFSFPPRRGAAIQFIQKKGGLL